MYQGTDALQKVVQQTSLAFNFQQEIIKKAYQNVQIMSLC